ncbi:hypothetical protein XM53_18290 [Roseovarius atlanticus]|uniref:Uncharacterized protein n=1 Tax=Roseovarius atlanticus TaxID=1641875 RepID=A0A0T5NPY5_9RHOB|nr:hypothetical protein [Roseovarius atlanticus]KRS11029.1 hypothetical protein XM53_18290 [Roseovarius atlanticus]
MEFVVAVFGGLIGALLGFLVQVFLSVRSSEVSAISDQIADLKRIEQFAIQYWLADKHDPQLNKELATKLRGAIMASSSFEEIGPQVLGCRFSKYSDLVLELDDIVTGGDFEDDLKDVDPARVVAAMRVTGELVSHLRVCRKFVYLWR